MMRKLFILWIVTIFTLGSCNAQPAEQNDEDNAVIDTAKVLAPDNTQPLVDKAVARIINRYHYKKANIGDSLSSAILDNYISMLDRNKLYFLKSDIERFDKYRTQIDDDLFDGNLDPAYDIFNTYKTRVTERVKYLLKRLDEGFDFTKNEYYLPDRTDTTWADTSSELDELWRKRIKNESLNLKLTGKEWDKVVETLSKRYKSFHKAILQYKPEDVFQLYMNSFAEAVDPHTSYFSPRTSENFNIQMSLSLEGIGASLRSIDDYTTVIDIIHGGPAYKSGKLEKDDKIIAVGQGKDGELLDVIGWRIDDVVQKIRGKKGTTVRLLVEKADAGADVPADTITLVRDKVKLEEQAAKKKIINIEEEGTEFKLGIIDVPTFYIDFEGRRDGDRDYKSTTRDVKKLLKELKEEKVDGVIIDLRNNGGGSLQEAIDLTGLFIKDGPVVQVRNKDGSIDVGIDQDSDIAYEGPLAVMVNRYSASASEIFSGAIQDYGRGLIIGENTYGKGTVQNLYDLNKFLVGTKDDLGQLKLTIAKYYRINGHSTQNKGVAPDIILPSEIDPEEFGESSNASALPWDQIASSDYKPYASISEFVPQLVTQHQERVKNNQEFQYILEDIKEFEEKKEQKQYSLNEEERKAEKEQQEAKRENRDEDRQLESEIEIEEPEEVSADSGNLKIDDPYLEEGGHILADFIIAKNGNE